MRCERGNDPVKTLAALASPTPSKSDQSQVISMLRKLECSHVQKTHFRHYGQFTGLPCVPFKRPMKQHSRSGTDLDAFIGFLPQLT